MTTPKFVGLSGNITAPSKTRALVTTALEIAKSQLQIETSIIEINDFGESLGRARRLSDLDPTGASLIETLLSADALIVATPIYKASYPGLFKHLIDLLDPASLAGKPVLIAATGGGEKHALAVEHQLRPLFGFFEAHSLPTAVHVSDKDFESGRLISAPALARLHRAVGQFGGLFPHHVIAAAAAE